MTNYSINTLINLKAELIEINTKGLSGIISDYTKANIGNHVYFMLKPLYNVYFTNKGN